MQIQPCSAPTDALEPAPLTSLALELGEGADIQAFWAGDDGYFVRTLSVRGEQWFRIDLGEMHASGQSPEALAKLGLMMTSVLPISTGRVAFPIGSTGRTVFRVWRSRTLSLGRTRILGVRAARSRRQPA